MKRITFACIAIIYLSAAAFAVEDAAPRWTAERANAWYAQQPWYVGANFVPSTASNQFEMWQAETFDPVTIDRELGWAAQAGFNGMRVYLHDMLWKADAAGFEERIDQYLSIANKHGIKTMLVLFDSVWNPFPELGKQEEPVPGVHNSRWVQSPHVDIQKDPAQWEPELKPYVAGILTRFKDDARVYAWDLLNEPGNPTPQYQPKEGWTREEKEAAHLELLKKLYAWAREVAPSQPLTTGVWVDVGKRKHPLDEYMLAQSDIITFHCYGPLKEMKVAVEAMKKLGRPVVCTEYMARSAGSTFKEILPYLAEQNVGAVNWGLVEGRSQTIYPWHSWEAPFKEEPKPWFHDVFRKDGRPYDEKEVALIRELSEEKNGKDEKGEEALKKAA